METSQSNNQQLGIMTGISEELGIPLIIRICTEKEFLAGSNTSAQGFEHWKSFKNHKWFPISDTQKDFLSKALGNY